ncbi:MAG: hypothetical protein P1U56_24550 [Saprospiraceae bacterium]|nr:hypothetical protein [Saprospiraceae bacterium]
MAFDKTKYEKTSNTFFWWSQELFVIWFTLILTGVIITPILYGESISSFFIDVIFPLIVLVVSLIVASLVSLTQITKYTIKRKEDSVKLNMRKVIYFASVIIIASYFILTKQVHFPGSDLMDPEADFFGRKYSLGHNYNSGSKLFKTILLGVFTYVVLWFVNLKRISKKNKV